MTRSLEATSRDDEGAKVTGKTDILHHSYYINKITLPRRTAADIKTGAMFYGMVDGNERF